MPAQCSPLENLKLSDALVELLSSCPLLHLHTLELNDVCPTPSHLFSYECKDVCIRELAVVDVDIPSTLSGNLLSVILGCCDLKCLRLSASKKKAEGLAALLTDALLKSSEQIQLQYFDLSGNYFGSLPVADLELLLGAIFSLPHLNRMTLDLSGNQLGLTEFLLANKLWKLKARGIKLKKLVCTGSEAKSEDVFLLRQMSLNVTV